jgi:hypothetical protein
MIYRKNIDENARDTFLITDIQASTIASKVIGIVPVKCELISVKEVHGTAAGQTGTIGIERLQGTETSGAGDNVVVATGINLEGTANTVQSGTIVKTSNIHQFAAGDRVGVELANNSATCATMIVACQFRPID